MVIKLGIIGYPLAHSLSPDLHVYLLNRLHKDGQYVRYECDESALPDLMRQFAQSGLTGFNVTIPYKKTIMPFLNERSLATEFIGAVNTVHLKAGEFWGYNTDCLGFKQALERRDVTVKNKAAVVFGAGGAARAVCFQLLESGVSALVIFNRTVPAAEKMARDLQIRFPSCKIEFQDLSTVEATPQMLEVDLFVNTTSLGMWPYVDSAPFVFQWDLSNKVVVDVVYNPLRTRFLQIAEDLHAETVDGLDMFIFQGVEALKIWLNIEGSIDFNYFELRNFLEEKLKSYGTA